VSDAIFPGGRASVGERSSPAPPIYGQAVFVYAAYFVTALVALMVSYLHDLRKTSGGEHAELSFILIGGIAAVGFSLAFSFVLDYFIGSSRALLFAPFRVLVFQPGSWLRHRDPQDPGSGLLHATVHGLHRLGGLLGRALLLGLVALQSGSSSRSSAKMVLR